MPTPSADPVFIGSSHGIPATNNGNGKSGDTRRASVLEETNKEIYKQNYELAVRNKTLSVLRSLYAITVSSLTLPEIAQSIVDSIVKELSFTACLITLIDAKEKRLKLLAMTQNPQMIRALELMGKPLSEIAIPLDFEDNLIIQAIKSKQMESTGNLFDILIPEATQETADQIEKITGIKTILTYPLFIEGKELGALTVGIPKKEKELSRPEQESLDELINVVAVALDRARLHDELRQANEQLKALDKLKDDFVSLASHELRTPMTAIKSYTWLVLNNKAGPLDPKAKEYIDRVYQSSERLIHLVNDMLDISRIESGRVQLRIVPFDVSKLFEDIKNEFQARVAEKSLMLETTCDTTITVQGDREKIHQVLENLIGNSLKFTPPEGKIVVSAKRVDSTIEVSVHDTGKGIDPQDKQRLFKKFGSITTSLISIPEKSTGLGLYICKQYVELHGGKIWAESQEGKGSTFTFTLPIAPPVSSQGNSI